MPNFDAFIGSLKSTTPTLRCCQRGARPEMADLFSEALEKVVMTNTEDSWHALFLLPFRALAVSEVKVPNLTTWVRQNITSCRNSSYKDWKPIARKAFNISSIHCQHFL
jgi:hypothetical protein